MMQHETQRRFLQASATVVLGRLHLPSDVADESRRRISKQSLYLEMLIPATREFLPPIRLGYIRNHYPIPLLNARTFPFDVTGAVKRPREFTLAELPKFNSVTRTVTLKCAGNRRSLLLTKVKGV